MMVMMITMMTIEMMMLLTIMMSVITTMTISQHSKYIMVPGIRYEVRYTQRLPCLLHNCTRVFGGGLLKTSVGLHL